MELKHDETSSASASWEGGAHLCEHFQAKSTSMLFS